MGLEIEVLRLYLLNNHHQITELWSSVYPILGLFYSAITDFLGFQVNEGEYKVMGLFFW